MADPASADSYSALERQFVEPFRRRLLLVTRPLVDLLARLGVHPNVLSVSQIPLGFGRWRWSRRTRAWRSCCSS
jgi:hypothetical protein